jgi:hypothetical protein
MTANSGIANPPKADRASAVASSTAEVRPAKKSRSHTPGGGTLGKLNSREAQRLAAAILEVLAGGRTPGQAAEALGVSVPRYYHLEGRALRALLEGCEPRLRGRLRNPERELTALRRQQERLQRELTRQQSLVRMAQRTIGLTPPAPLAKASPSKKRRRRPVVRALQAATHLQQQSQEAAVGPTSLEGAANPA